MAQYCPFPGCPVIVPSGYCPSHARTLDAQRGSRSARGYNRRWLTRARLFRQKYPLCGMRPGGVPPVMSRCYDEGRITIAYQTDHVIPHKGNLDLFWDELGNWQALCAECGSRKSRAGL